MAADTLPLDDWFGDLSIVQVMQSLAEIFVIVYLAQLCYEYGQHSFTVTTGRIHTLDWEVSVFLHFA